VSNPVYLHGTSIPYVLPDIKDAVRKYTDLRGNKEYLWPFGNGYALWRIDVYDPSVEKTFKHFGVDDAERWLRDHPESAPALSKNVNHTTLGRILGCSARTVKRRIEAGEIIPDCPTRNRKAFKVQLTDVFTPLQREKLSEKAMAQLDK